MSILALGRPRGARRLGRRLGLRRLVLGLATAALTFPAGALAEIEVKGLDTTAYPEVRAVVVAPDGAQMPPQLTENGEPVAGYVAENLGRAKSVVLAVDHSQSMNGRPLEDAIAAARAFIGAKPPEDRIALTTFASDALTLTDFSTATIDVDTALRTLAIDDERGTALYDAIVTSARALNSEPLPARVIILVTDGQEMSSAATIEEAITAARKAGVAVYPVGIEGKYFNPEPLQRIAAETGGTYYGAASSDALVGIYSSIAEELTRTWQVEWVTAARPGEALALAVTAGGETATAETTAPGASPTAVKPEPSKLVPRALLESSWGPLAVGAAAGLVVLLACAFLFASPKGSWVRNRIQPHLGERKRRVVRRRTERERRVMTRALFQATERAFEGKRWWLRLQRRLERADFPLRAAEFVYVMAASGFVVGIVAAAAGVARPFVVLGLVGGALVPWFLVGVKGRRRLRAFENQLPDLLVTVATSLKAGHSFRQGIQSVVDEGAEPASKEFKRVLTETQLGRSMDDALADMAARVGSKDLEFVINSVTIQRQVGGSLAGLFDMIADTVRNRQQFQRKVKGLTSMGRASAYVLVALPFFVAGAVTMMNAEYMDPLYHSSTGHKLIVAMVVMMGIGVLALKKIVSFRG
jgi:tight adherence protein B